VIEVHLHCVEHLEALVIVSAAGLFVTLSGCRHLDGLEREIVE
jgi:hypothetical protein